MSKENDDRRKYSRYGTQMKVYFTVKYDIRTKVEFKVLKSADNGKCENYSGISKNISVEGLCFVSDKQLGIGDRLSIDIYAPNSKIPVPMEAEVCWSRKFEGDAEDKDMFHTGVKLISVNGQSVSKSIHFDKEYQVIWSEVLESVFGNFALLVKQMRDQKKD
jgi:hypothetical protein